MSTHRLEIAELLLRAGFTLREPGYWSFATDHFELTLEPQVLNAGAYKLQLYERRRPLLDVELLVDVKPRPRADVEPR